ncbi:hypothetical protein [Mucilaginibacter ginkgonis]|uniref:Glycosyltransferase involved in cell wall biosynthesis n=1 Tax=Mucilaginibacter ginkgonis TaxID=2682091 RepID=A0A6I4HV43_9SPHI|nr:hypothetical protein [Mucilaginibacter ginkgonis]QQL50207.1 hypothetical protein GO620_001775 [Mucilaginibacter ginkgonis]
MYLKYHFNISIGSAVHNAGNKAVNDCKRIMLDNGYIDLEISFSKKPYMIITNFLKLVYYLIRSYLLIKSRSIIVVQYPLLGINRFFPAYIGLLHYKKCKVICLIHDIESLRFQRDGRQIQKEIDGLNSYDLVISHNELMTKWLRKKGLNVVTKEINMFDYLFKSELINVRINNDISAKQVAFAGNLQRGKFLSKLKCLPGKVKFIIFGTLEDLSIPDGENVFYDGSYAPDQLLGHLKGNFGLIWDGDETADCSGPFGNYIRYNNPHKLSLYLAAGLPIIMPEKAALAHLIHEYKIGFTINDLSEIATAFLQIGEQEYHAMLKNTRELSQKVKEGFFLQTVLKDVEIELLHQEK